MRFAVLVFYSTCISAQIVSLGVKGGLPLSQTLDGEVAIQMGLLGMCGECATGRTLPYTVGPAMEVHFTGRFSVSAEVLFSRADFTHTSTFLSKSPPVGSGVVSEEKHTVNRWEVPVLLKHSPKPWHGVNPFIAMGVSVQHTRDTMVSFMQLEAVPPDVFFVAPDDRLAPATSTGLGGVFALGASFSKWRVRPSLEYRYTHWADQSVVVHPGSSLDTALGFPTPGTPPLHSSQSQSTLLAGLMFDLKGETVPSGDRNPGTSARFRFGLKGGLPLTQALDAHSGAVIAVFNKCGECATQRTLPYVVGPELEVRLVGSFRMAAGVLYSHVTYGHVSSSFSVSGTSDFVDAKHAVNRWELPILLNFGLAGTRQIHPFVAAGASVQYSRDKVVSSLTGFTDSFGNRGAFATPRAPAAGSFAAGPTVGAGVEFGTARARPSIGFRYTRWFNEAISVGVFDTKPIAPDADTVHSIQNQLQLLVGLTF